MADPVSLSPQTYPPPCRLSRRGFLRIIASAGIAGFVGKAALDALEASQVVRQARLLMGTIVDLTLVVPGRETAAAGAGH